MPRSLPILIVDDIEICRVATTAMLMTLGFECITAENGDDALEIYHQSIFGAVIMDYAMPGISGAECTKLIRDTERSTGSHIPIICLTGNGNLQVWQECLNAGCDAVLPKDTSASSLINILEPLILRNIRR